MKTCLILLSLCTVQLAHAALTKDFIVTKVFYNQNKKYYEINFKNQAGVYKTGDVFLSCLRTSLKEAKPARVVFEPSGLAITSCKMGETK